MGKSPSSPITLWETLIPSKELICFNINHSKLLERDSLKSHRLDTSLCGCLHVLFFIKSAAHIRSCTDMTACKTSKLLNTSYFGALLVFSTLLRCLVLDSCDICGGVTCAGDWRLDWFRAEQGEGNWKMFRLSQRLDLLLLPACKSHNYIIITIMSPPHLDGSTLTFTGCCGFVLSWTICLINYENNKQSLVIFLVFNHKQLVQPKKKWFESCFVDLCQRQPHPIFIIC